MRNVGDELVGITLSKKVIMVWMIIVLVISSVPAQLGINQSAHAAATIPYVGEIQLFPYDRAPKGWVYAAGQSLPINQNSALFALLGTTFGGDGRTTFQVPNLTGKAPVGMGYYIALNGLFPSRDEGLSGSSNSTLGEVRLFPYYFVPTGWKALQGQTLSIQSYTDLYNMIGTKFGGDATNTFQLPVLTDLIPNVKYAISTDPSFQAENGTGDEYVGEVIPYLVPVVGNNLLSATGNLLSMNQNNVLYSLLEYRFGGNNQTVFAVPDLRGYQAQLNYYIVPEGLYPSLTTDQPQPVVNNDSYSVSQNKSQTGNVLTNDQNVISVGLQQPPAHGQVTMSPNGSFVYTPTIGYVGNDSFLYTGANASSGRQARVDITVLQGYTPVIDGVTNNSVYANTVTPTFNEGTATLNGVNFGKGTSITTDGIYTLIVTNEIGSTTVKFTIDQTKPVITGVVSNMSYSTAPQIQFNEGTATLDNIAFNNGDTVSTEGDHTLVVTDLAGNQTTITFKVYFKRTLTFNSDGGSAIADMAVDYQSLASAPSDPTKSGYTFIGWYTDEAKTKPFSFTTTPINTDITLYAKWSVNAYKLSFETNGGTVVTDQMINYKELAIPPVAPERTGYTFAGWYTDNQLQSVFDFTSMPITTDMILYAKWLIKPYTATFDTDGGSLISDQLVNYQSLVKSPTDPIKSGYTFAGWYSDAARTTLYDWNTAITDNITLYGKWSKNAYTVSFDTYGGSAVANINVDYGDKIIAPASPTKFGYAFVGWYTDATLTTLFDFGQTPITSNTTLYADWSDQVYTVSFNTYGGSTIDDIFVNHGGKITAPTSPTRSGYTFVNWYLDNALTIPFDFDTTAINSNIMLQAKWKKKEDSTSNSTGSGGTSVPDKEVSTNGLLLLTKDQAGEVSLDNDISIRIPVGSINQPLNLSIVPIAEPANLMTNLNTLVSRVYELNKNFTQNFSIPITLTFAFNSAMVQPNQQVGVFYFDENQKIWISTGNSQVNGNQISTQVDHFTKYAVFVSNVSESVTPVVPPVTEPVAVPTATALTDIQGHWAEMMIQQAVSEGLVKGYTDGTFKPGAPVTRAEFMVMIMNGLSTSQEEAVLSFSDQNSIGSWAKSAIARAVQAGFIQGDAKGTFRPNAPVTRAEMAVIVSKVLQLNINSQATPSFADGAKIPKWAQAAVVAMQKSQLLSGKGNNTFAATDATTRAEAVKVLLSMRQYQK